MAFSAQHFAYKIAVRPGTMAGKAAYVWEVRHFKQLIATGAEATEEKAYHSAAKPLAKLIAGKAKHVNTKQLAQLRILNYLKRRPYMVAAAVEAFCQAGC